ncbi:MAG: PA14 domain-containing protein [Prosthecobacter sp.]
MIACVLAGFHAAPAFAVIDDELTGNVWKVKYGVTATQWSDANWLLADSDGDGMSNGAELGFGTNPFISGEVVKITEITLGATNANLTFPTLSGKKYVMQGSATLSGFADLAPAINTTGNGSPKTLSGPKGSYQFFRVLVQDIDTDGDGVSDWAELQTGSSPTNATSSPGGVNDHDYLAPQFAAPYAVNIMAVNPFASEDGPTAGTFEVTRTNKLNALTVTLNTSGTAFGGTDYNEVLPATVTFAAGEDKKTLTVTPKQDTPFNEVEGSKSVISALSLAGVVSSFPVALGTNPSATVIIGDTTAATGTGLLARYYDTGSGTYLDAANFGEPGSYNFTRLSPTTMGSIVVTHTNASLASSIQIGHLVRLTFTTGNLNNALYNNANYTVTAVSGQTFTVGITALAVLPVSGTGICNLSYQTTPHPAVITRVDATVNNDWIYGTPNAVVISPTNSPDNYSASWETYLQPSTAGDYTFQLDADDKARVLIDLNIDGDFLDVGEQVVEHGWDTLDGNLTPEVVGTFKPSAAINFVVPASPALRRKMRVEHVDTTGDARCRLQWKLNSGSYANIPQANQFTHTQPLTYSYTAGNAVITPTGGHSFIAMIPCRWLSPRGCFSHLALQRLIMELIQSRR